MKKLILSLLLMVTVMTGARAQDVCCSDTCHYTIEKLHDYWLNHIETDFSHEDSIKVYPTKEENMFLVLDSHTGKISLVQRDPEIDIEVEVIINDDDFALDDDSRSFELYPTKDEYLFILMDKNNARMWYVHWGIEDDDDRWIKRTKY